MAGGLGIFALGLAALGAAGWWFSVIEKRSKAMLENWATESGLELLKVQIKPIVKGPYWFASKAQIVYRISVREAGGAERQGWARCGGPLGGPLVNQVDVKWDSPRSTDLETPREPE